MLHQRQEQRYPALQVYPGSVRVSAIHGTLTWTTWSLTCVRDHSYACLCIRMVGWAHRQRVSATLWTRKTPDEFFLAFLTGLEPRVFGPRVWRSTNWATPSPPSREDVQAFLSQIQDVMKLIIPDSSYTCFFVTNTGRHEVNDPRF